MNPVGERAPLDLLIQGARIFAEGGTWLAGDVGIEGDRIACVGATSRRATRTLRADGLWAVPGFVDLHNHADLGLLKLDGAQPDVIDVLEAGASSSQPALRQGATTIVTGNCGQGLTDLGAWQALFAESGFATNVAHFVPYGSLRREVVGNARDDGPLGRRVIDIMKERIAEQMGKGALGFSTAFDSAPQCHATTDELIEYCRMLAQWNGIYLTHIRAEAGEAMLAAIAEAIEIAEKSGVPVHLSQLRMYRAGGGVDAERILELLESARGRGVRLTASQNPYTTVGGMFDLHFVNHLLSNLRPRTTLGASVDRAELRETLADLTQIIGAEHMLVTHDPSRAGAGGKSIGELAEAQGESPADVLWSLYENQGAYLTMDVFSESAMQALMKPSFVFTSSNGEAPTRWKPRTHPRSYGAFPRKLRRYALDRAVVSVEQALRSMAEGPAEFLRLADRGRIQPGYFADLVLLDPRTVADELDYVHPNRYPPGVVQVIVNGKLSFEPAASANGRLLSSANHVV